MWCQLFIATIIGTIWNFRDNFTCIISGASDFILIYYLLFTNTNLVSRLGRKKLIIFSGITAATMGLGRSITSSYWVYVVLELIEALFGDTYSATFMLG